MVILSAVLLFPPMAYSVCYGIFLVKNKEKGGTIFLSLSILAVFLLVAMAIFR